MAAVAGRQERVFTLAQARRCGLDTDALRWRIAQGWMHRVHPGVYAFGPAPLTGQARLRAATYAGGATAALSHQGAGWLRRAISTAPQRADVTTVRRRRGPHGVRMHRTRGWAPEDVDDTLGFRVTTWARTIVDLAEVLPRRRLARALRESEFQRVFDLRALERAIDRAHGRHGLRSLLAVLADHQPRGATESPLEDLFQDFLDARRLALPLTQVWIEACGARHRVDAYFPHARLCVELDGRQAHTLPDRFVTDRRRDVDLHVAGFVPIRLTTPDLTTGADRTERRLRQLGVANR